MCMLIIPWMKQAIKMSILQKVVPNLVHKIPPTKLTYLKGSHLDPTNIIAVKQWWPSQEMYEEDSEENEEERENIVGDTWREVNGDDDETEEEE